MDLQTSQDPPPAPPRFPQPEPTLEQVVRGIVPREGAPPAEQGAAKMILLHVLLAVMEAGEVPELHREPVEAFLAEPSDETARAAREHVEKHKLERRSNQEKGALYGCLAVAADTASACAGYVLGAAQAAARHIAGRDCDAEAEEKVLALVRAELVAAKARAKRATRSR
ncbi:MAG: hypothetical protein M9894_17165 [Planctomycetes bacterium]|nr:hypothetical protein [Planctomycetota bacterium]